MSRDSGTVLPDIYGEVQDQCHHVIDEGFRLRFQSARETEAKVLQGNHLHQQLHSMFRLDLMFEMHNHI